MRNHVLPLVLFVLAALGLLLAAFNVAISDDFNLAYLSLAVACAGLAAECATHSNRV